MPTKQRVGGYLGLYLQDCPQGVLVTGTYPESPAAKLGFLPGDCIVQINDHGDGLNGDLLIRTLFTSEKVIFKVVRANEPFHVSTSVHELDRILSVGDVAPDCSLPKVDGDGSVRHSSLWNESPLFLVFGSYT